jgi:hypothetical protein
LFYYSIAFPIIQMCIPHRGELFGRSSSAVQTQCCDTDRCNGRVYSLKQSFHKLNIDIFIIINFIFHVRRHSLVFYMYMHLFLLYYFCDVNLFESFSTRNIILEDLEMLDVYVCRCKDCKAYAWTVKSRKKWTELETILIYRKS